MCQIGGGVWGGGGVCRVCVVCVSVNAAEFIVGIWALTTTPFLLLSLLPLIPV